MACLWRSEYNFVELILSVHLDLDLGIRLNGQTFEIKGKCLLSLACDYF